MSIVFHEVSQVGDVAIQSRRRWRDLQLKRFLALLLASVNAPNSKGFQGPIVHHLMITF
eukprot:14751.XXX_544191_544367_1 [CDS] Oithona nana genome sequencing.